MVLVFSTHSSITFAWGRDGHTAVGILAIEQLPEKTHQALELIIGPLDQQTMLEACNWPDDVRDTEEWSWTYPMHYINIPRGDFNYLESRDCPDQHCATQAIKRYAGELADPGISKEKRWQAFAMLCHITGDLHQPLHAGFADDRGGNDFEVVFRDEETNLHSIWDSRMIDLRADNVAALTNILARVPDVKICGNWSPGMVNRWTDGSHKLASQVVYPSSPNIDEAYEKRSWELIQRRLKLAAARLALIIDTVFE